MSPPPSPPLGFELLESNSSLQRFINLHVRLLLLVNRITPFVSDAVILFFVREIRRIINEFFLVHGARATFAHLVTTPAWRAHRDSLQNHHHVWFQIAQCVFEFTQCARTYVHDEHISDSTESSDSAANEELLQRTQ